MLPSVYNEGQVCVSNTRRNYCYSRRFATALFCIYALVSTNVAFGDTPSPPSAANLLLEKAQFWYEHGEEKVALEMYQRVVSFDQDNVDANVGAARMALTLGKPDIAEQYIARLKRIAPNDAAVLALGAFSSRSPAQTALLAEARHLTDGGKFPAALAKYRDLFGAAPPPVDLSGEYYTLIVRNALANSVEQENAVDALRKVADAQPQDKSLRLWLARALALTDGYRSEGIGIFAELSADPIYTARVRPLWRYALIWGGASDENRKLLSDYLRHYPSDPDLDALRDQMTRELPSEARLKIMLGNSQLEAGQLAEAEQSYRDAMQADPKEPDSYVMLSILRMKQGRAAEARRLADQAIALAPSREQEVLADIGQDQATLRKSAEAARQQFAAQYQRVNDLAAAGNYAEATALLQQLTAGHENAGSLLLLANIHQRAGDDAEASRLLNRAVSLAPNNPDALLALAAMETQTGQLSDAHVTLTQADKVLRNSGTSAQRETWRRTLSGLQRREAVAEHDPSRRSALLADALAAQPDDNWLRFELARTLETLNRKGDAETAIAPVLSAASAPDAARRQSGVEAIQVAFAWLDVHNQHRQAMALAAALPDALRSAQMRSALADVALRREIAVRLAGSNSDDALLDLAGQPDPDGARGQTIGRALMLARGVQAMRDALTAGLNATPAPASLTRLRYASLLIETHQFVAARALLAAIRPASLAPAEHDEFLTAQDQLAAAEVGRWLQAGNVDQAVRILAARRDRIAGNPVLQTADARIAMARGRAAQALGVLTPLLDSNPDNPVIRAAAIDAALATDQPRRAAALAEDGMRINPDNPFLAMQAANIARQQGRGGDALQYLRRARALRIDELNRDLSTPPS